MATWDELRTALRASEDDDLRTSTDADLDDFEAARGVKLPPSYREFAKTFGRCVLARWSFAAPGHGDGEYSKFDLATFDAMMQGLAQDDIIPLHDKMMPNAEVGARLVFFASDPGDYSCGFDPTEVTDAAAGECAVYLRDDRPRGYVRVASSFREFVMEYCLGDKLQEWREWSEAGGEANLKDEDDDDYDEDEDKRLFLQPM